MTEPLRDDYGDEVEHWRKCAEQTKVALDELQKEYDQLVETHSWCDYGDDL